MCERALNDICLVAQCLYSLGITALAAQMLYESRTVHCSCFTKCIGSSLYKWTLPTSDGDTAVVLASGFFLVNNWGQRHTSASNDTGWMKSA